MAASRRMPETKTLWDILPKGTEGGKEFARIVDLLRFHELHARQVSLTRRETITAWIA